MTTTYANELGKCYAQRNNLRVYKDRDLFGIYIVAKEWDFDANDNIIEGEREEAVLVGYVSDLANLEYAFDMAELEIKATAEGVDA